MGLKTTIRTAGGRRFEAPVANLTPNTLLAKTAQPLAFRDIVTLELLSHEVRGIVVCACVQPRGAVVWFESPPTLREAVRGVMAEVPVEAPAPVDADAWHEITNVSSDLPEAPTAPTPAPTPSPSAPAPGTPFEAESESSVGPLEAPWADASVLMTGDEALSPDLAAALEAGRGAALAPPSAPAAEVAKIQLSRAALPDLEPSPPPVAPAAPRAAEPEPPAAAAPPLRTGGSAASAPPLPQLRPDGFTIDFASVEAYREQYASHLMHGGLVVAADPMAVGTQRMLVLTVPGREPYTVSARVVFNQPGVVGFMLDSIGLHRGRLEALRG